MTPEIEIFPIAIGKYDNHPDVEADRQVGRVADLLADFGAAVLRPWGHPMADRGRDAVDARLQEWSTHGGGKTLLYWVGHGWSSTRDAALAHARSPAVVAHRGVAADDLADQIARWENGAEPDAWLFVVIDACQSARFAELLAARLDDRGGRRRILVIGTAGRGATTVGRFADALETALRWTFGNELSIPVSRLSRELVRTISDGTRRMLNLDDDDAVLHRFTPVPNGYTGTIDVREALLAALADLSDDEKRHFVPKAQGGELRADGDALGELAWHFTGREVERGALVHRLTHDTGMVVVTGRAGSGKSALLGDVLVRSRPALAAVLITHGLVEPTNQVAPPPFHAALLLTGLTSAGVLTRVCEVLGLRRPDPAQPVTEQLRHLTRAVDEDVRDVRILTDALDEAVDPFGCVAVLRAVARAAGALVVVGTRQSTAEGPDLPDTADKDLLDALGDLRPVVVNGDPAAMVRYVTERLGRVTDDGDAVAAAARAIADTGQEFLYARLAVHELAARPELLHAGRPVPEILGSTHRGLFSTAVDRLARMRPAYRSALRALGLAQGRGIPIQDGVWQAVSAVLGDASLTAPDVTALVVDAAPYLVLDGEHGQTVYRLGHRTFAEHFAADPETSAVHSRITEVAVRMLAADGPVNEYWRHHATAHARAGGPPAWAHLAGAPHVLDRVDLDSAIGDVMRGLFGRAVVPPPLAALIAAAPQLRDAVPEDRAWLREISTARQTDHYQDPNPGDADRIQLRWARMALQPLALSVIGPEYRYGNWVHPLRFHRTSKSGWTSRFDESESSPLAAVPLRNGSTLLATSWGQLVRLWDPLRTRDEIE